MAKQASRARTCAWWTMLTAGALGFTSQVRGQRSPYMPVRPQPQVLPSTPAQPQVLPSAITGLPAKPEDASLEARIELAWLSNPATFPYSLQARLTGSALEVRGYVPSEPVRAQALRLAQDESHLRIIDNLKIHASLAQPTVSKSPQALSRQAMSRLKQTLSSQASHLTVSVWTNGQILVKGTVPTMSAKLTASRCLREVSGCTCVINQLQVVKPEWAAVATMPPLTRSVALGRGPSAQQPGAVVPTVGQIILDEPGPVVSTIGQIILDAGLPSKAVAEQPVATWKEPPAQEGVKPSLALSSYRGSLPPSAAAVSPSSAWDQVKSPYTFHPTTWRRMEAAGSRVSQTTSEGPVRPATFSLASGAANGEIRQAAAQEVNRPAPGSAAVIKLGAGEPAPTRESNKASLPIITTGTPQTSSRQGAGDASTTIVLGVPNRVDSVRQQAQPARPVGGAVPRPEVTSGLILLDRPQAVTMPKPNLESEQRLAELQVRIARACGRRPPELEVTCPAVKTLRVRIRARDQKEAERLSNAIFQLPELDPYEVSLDIPVAR